MNPTLAATRIAPVTRLIAPRLALASCVRAYITRSTIGCDWMDAPQRFNRFPASPMCSVSWMTAGEAHMAGPTPGLEMIIPQAFFGGPQSHPTLSYNPGQGSGLMVMFYPAALQKLSGIDLAAWLDRFGPLGEALGPEWEALSRAVLDAADDDARIALIEAFLEPRWQAARAGAEPFGVVGDWVRRLAVQAAAAGWGGGVRTVRNVERRIKAWAGQPMRKLRRLDRAEHVFLAERDDIFGGQAATSWTDIAARGGYADQAHLCREVREITGLSPTELARAYKEDESYWIYRIWN